MGSQTIRNNIQVLETKIHPPIQNPKTIVRDRLNHVFIQHLDKKLISFKSPAGFGKTTIVSHSIDRIKEKGLLAWLTCDEMDDDPTYFFHYLCFSIQEVAPNLKQSIDDLLNTFYEDDLKKSYLRLLDIISNLEEEMYIVLDDFYHIRNEEILKALSFFLERSYEHIHFIILSRGDIKLEAISKLRLNDQIFEFYKDILRFTDEETKSFLEERFQEPIDFESLNKIQDKIEGWAAGLQLACIRLQTADKKINEYLDVFLAQDTNVSFYLNEVVQNLNKNLRKEVYRLAILQEFNFEIIEPYLNRTDGNKLIDQLRSLSLFLNKTDNGWYRFDNIFRDFLLSEIYKKFPNAAPALHQIAGKWFYEQKLYDKAIYHFSQTNDNKGIADIIEVEASKMMFEGRLALLESWIEILPANILASRPVLFINYLWLLAVTSQLGKLQKNLSEYEKLIELHQNDLPQLMQSTPYLNTIKAIICLQKGQLNETIEMSQKALDSIDETNLPVKVVAHGNIGMAALNLGKLDLAIEELTLSLKAAKVVKNKFWQSACGFLLGQALSWNGDLVKANKIFSSIFDWNRKDKHNNLPALSMAYIGQGQIYLQWNKLDEAYDCLKEGLRLGKKLQNDETKIICYINLSGIFLLRNDMDNFRYAVQKALDIGEETEVERLKLNVQVMHSAICLRMKEWDKVEEYKRKFSIEDYSAYPLIEDNVNIFYVHYYYEKEKYDIAFQYLDKIDQTLEVSYKYRLALESRIYRALILYALGEKENAFDLLNQVIEKAASSYFVRVFLAKGPSIYDLLKDFYNHRVDKISYDLLNFITDLLRFCDEEFDIQSQSQKESKDLPLEYLIDPLTARELDVLNELSLGLKNKEIADKLFISVGTVKTHVLKIYGKLEVRNRTEAITKARDLKII